MPRSTAAQSTKEEKNHIPQDVIRRAANRANGKPKPAEPARKALPVRSRRRDVDTREQVVGQDRPRTLKSTGPAREALEPAHIEPVEHPVSREKLEALAFNEEVLTVLVHDSTNPTDEPVPEVWNDGRCQRFLRGKEMQVKRKYVEVLARSKKTIYTQEELPNRGGYRNVPHTALRYPFSVLHDPSGDRGKAWLQAILAQA